MTRTSDVDTAEGKSMERGVEELLDAANVSDEARREVVVDEDRELAHLPRETLIEILTAVEEGGRDD